MLKTECAQATLPPWAARRCSQPFASPQPPPWAARQDRRRRLLDMPRSCLRCLPGSCCLPASRHAHAVPPRAKALKPARRSGEAARSSTPSCCQPASRPDPSSLRSALPCRGWGPRHYRREGSPENPRAIPAAVARPRFADLPPLPRPALRPPPWPSCAPAAAAQVWETTPGFGEEPLLDCLWSSIDEAINLKECDVYRWALQCMWRL